MPSWVRYPDRERVGWVNDILSQLWPQAAAAAAVMARPEGVPAVTCACRGENLRISDGHGAIRTGSQRKFVSSVDAIAAQPLTHGLAHVMCAFVNALIEVCRVKCLQVCQRQA